MRDDNNRLATVRPEMFNGGIVIGQSPSSMSVDRSSPHVVDLGLRVPPVSNVEGLQVTTRLADCSSTAVFAGTDRQSICRLSPCAFTVEQVVCLCEVLLASVQVTFNATVTFVVTFLIMSILCLILLIGPTYSYMAHYIKLFDVMHVTGILMVIGPLIAMNRASDLQQLQRPKQMEISKKTNRHVGLQTNHATLRVTTGRYR